MLPDSFRLLGQKLIESNPWYLAPFSWIYAAVVFLRNVLYEKHIFSIIKVPPTVVSIGNIVAGGTGKTPLTLHLAEAFSHKRVAILSRGYGSVADEAMLLKKRVPTAHVFIGKDRAKLAFEIKDQFDLILLDDGLQHRKLFRDFDLVLTKEKKEHYLPWGFLRDSPKRLKGATLFSQDDFQLETKQILDLKGNQIDSIFGKEVFLFCGIANPKRFRESVTSLGAQIIGEKYFADHGKIDVKKLAPASLYICTEKDAVKIGPTDLPIIYLQMQVRLTQGVEKWQKLIEKIAQKIDNQCTYE